MNQKTLFDNLIIVKRSGQRTSFQGEKIAIAIQKAFESVDIPYKDEDVNKIYERVLKEIEKKYQDRKTINIENIQDIIEEVLKKQKFEDVYIAFSTYRNHRNASRKAFVIKQQHKFLKAIESLGLNNITDDTKNPQELLEQFGSTISQEFAKAYLLDNKITRASDSGAIYIHEIEKMPMGSIENIEIDLEEVQNLETPLGKLLKNQKTINDYLMQLSKLINEMKEEQYSDIAFIHFDNDLIDITKKHFTDILINKIELYIKLEELENFISTENISNEIKQSTNIEQILTKLQNKFDNKPKRNNDLETIFNIAIKEIETILIESINIFLKTLPKINISLNFGTNISILGKFINKAIIKSINKTTNNISYFFKVKNGISYKPQDPNYDLLEEYINQKEQNNNCYLIFLDNKFNKLEQEEAAYFAGGKRVIDDNTTLDKKNIGGKGNLATVSINLVRAALKAKNEEKIDERLFYQTLEQMLFLAKDTLLAKFELQCNKSIENFNHLYKDGLWHDGEKLRENDRLRKLLKHGSLTIHFCGLEETIKVLDPKADQQKIKQLAFEIIKFMKKKIDKFSEENNLNFSLSAIEYENVQIEFKKQDTAIFGKIKGVTDKDAYTRGDNINLSIEDIGKLQNYLNGGHLLDLKSKNIIEQIKNIKEAGIGCIHLKENV